LKHTSTVVLSLLAGVVGVSTFASRVRAEGCPEARTLRLAASLSEAEAAARRCLQAESEDVATWLELSRALGLQQQTGPALEWVERGLLRYPDDVDLALWQVRLLAWSGRLHEAQAGLVAVTTRVPEVMRDRETAMLAADIRYWSHDWTGADARFASYLESWPDDGDARTKLAIVRDALAQESSILELAIEPSIATGGRADAIATRVTLNARVWDALRVGVTTEVRDREGTGETSVYGLVGWRGADFVIEGGIGGDVGQGIGPEFSAWIEPSVHLAKPLWATLRYWRLDFADDGAHVLSPGLVATVGSVELDFRYWLGLEDSGTTSHAGLFRARWSLASEWTLEAGGGAGTGADYLEPREGERSGHWLGLVGLRFSPSWQHRFSAGYVQRHETSGDASQIRHEIGLGWQVAL